MKTKFFPKIFENFENFSLKMQKKFPKFFENFWKLYLKNAKKNQFLGKIDGVPKPPESLFAITKTTWRKKSAKGPLQHLW